MAFKEILQHDDIFNQIKELYSSFESLGEFNPYVCDPKNEEMILNMNKALRMHLNSCLEWTNDLHKIMQDSYGC